MWILLRRVGVVIVALMFFINSFSSISLGVYARKVGQLYDVDVSQWIKWAEEAWRYYEPDVGVDPATGILRGSYRWHFTTDWDLGGYIMAIIMAELMGLLPKDGKWGADYRIDKILNFLETRSISSYGIPYWAYSSATGSPLKKGITNVSDAGRLLIALALLKKYRPDLANRIDQIVRRNGFEILANHSDAWKTTAGFYRYYVAQGFKFFGFDKSSPVQKALEEFEKIMNGPHVNVYGISLPKTEVTSEPLLHMVFEVGADERFMDYVKRVYEVQEKRYHETGRYTAWSEGNTGLHYSPYVYQWIVTPSGETWKITPKITSTSITPIIFTKVAFGFHAIFNTEYTRTLVDYLVEKNEWRKKNSPYMFYIPAKGFIEGVDENGRIVAELIDKTQDMIIEAAYYALKIRALESADVSIEISSPNIGPDKVVLVNLTYIDPTPLKHICKYSMIINGVNTPYSVQYEFHDMCNAGLRWKAPRDGVYNVKVRAIVNYVLFNKTIEKSFVINIGSVHPISEHVVVNAGIIYVKLPEWVCLDEEFELETIVRYDFGESIIPFKVIVRNYLTEEVVAESTIVDVSGNGTMSLKIMIKAPGEEGILSLILIPAYNDGNRWIELMEGIMSVEIKVLSKPAGERVIVGREIIHVTVTRSIIIERVSAITYTVTEKLGSGFSLGPEMMFVMVMVCSAFLFTIAAMTMALRLKRFKRSVERVEEPYR